MNQTHKEIADVGAGGRLIEERVLPVEDRFLQGTLTNGVVQGSAGDAEEERQRCPKCPADRYAGFLCEERRYSVTRGVFRCV